MWNRLRFHPFLQVSQIFKKRKSDANKQDFKIKLNLTCQAQSHKNNRDLDHGILHLWSKFGGRCLNGWWVIERNSLNVVNFYFEVKFGLEGQCQSPSSKTIGILTKVFYIHGPSLMILAWTSPELSCGQSSDWHTDWHTHTDTSNDNTRRPNCPRVKTSLDNWTYRWLSVRLQ